MTAREILQHEITSTQSLTYYGNPKLDDTMIHIHRLIFHKILENV